MTRTADHVEAVDGRAYTADETLAGAATDSEHADRSAYIAEYGRALPILLRRRPSQSS